MATLLNSTQFITQAKEQFTNIGLLIQLQSQLIQSLIGSCRSYQAILKQRYSSSQAPSEDILSQIKRQDDQFDQTIRQCTRRQEELAPACEKILKVLGVESIKKSEESEMLKVDESVLISRVAAKQEDSIEGSLIKIQSQLNSCTNFIKRINGIKNGDDQELTEITQSTLDDLTKWVESNNFWAKQIEIGACNVQDDEQKLEETMSESSFGNLPELTEKKRSLMSRNEDRMRELEQDLIVQNKKLVICFRDNDTSPTSVRAQTGHGWRTSHKAFI